MVVIKNISKIIISVVSVLSLLSLSFWLGSYFCGGISYLYHSQEVVNDILIFFVVTIVAFAVYIAAIVAMFKSRKSISIVCAVLLIASVPVCLYGSFVHMLGLSIMGPNGCSYTEDIANYETCVKEYKIDYFPATISSDMTVIDFVYFYKYIDISQNDLYLEVQFENRETMDKYLDTAKNSFSENGFIAYENPYDSRYTDVIENRQVRYSGDKKSLASVITFGGDEDYAYVDMIYPAVTYSYDELTIIYNYTAIGSDIKVGDNPDDGEYYPEFLKRFDVEWDSDNNFEYYYVES